jgi:hypothetical protein
MASNINPNNIDTTYPIAGQDNDSQGFRDNFTNIKTNFTYAESEIDDLQSKVLLKSALTGASLDNDLAGALLENAKLQGVRYTKVDSASTTGNVSVDFSAGQMHKVGTITGNVTLGFSNIPSAGNYAEWTVELTPNATPTLYTVTLPSAVSVGNTKVQNATNNVITYTDTGSVAYKFATWDGGSTIAVEELYRDAETLTMNTEDLADAAAASLLLGASYVATGASGETATLAAGVEGQVKVFAMTTDGGGDMVITVTNPAWGGSGTITLADVGDGCTLLYTNSKWVCIGNNGCAFA